MFHKPAIILCTVGTSLFYPNLNNLNPQTAYPKEPKPDDTLGLADKVALMEYGLWQDRQKLVEILEQLKKFYIEKNWPQMTKQLLKLPPSLRLCGAEINSMDAMIRKNFLSSHRERLLFLVSDTEDGNSIGSILSSYFQDARCPIGFKVAEYEVIEGIQDERPLDFQRKGLPNLVRIMGKQLRQWGDTIGINATGGYKAQIALAVAFGQATSCPVFYKHERFNQIIRFPQVPFTMDLGMVGENLRLWADLADPETLLTEEQLNRLLSPQSPIYEPIKQMLDSVEVDGIEYFALSSLGMVYWEAYRGKNPEALLEPRSVQKREGCHFPEHHYPLGFQEYVWKIYNSFPKLIQECHSIPYHGQKAIQQNCFYISQSRIIGEYVDKNKFGARFEIRTEAKNQLEREWVVKRLDKWLEEG